MTDERKYRNEAKTALPAKFCVLPCGEILKADDLVWSWTTKQWHRADSPLWLLSPLVYREEIICAARKIEMSQFEKSVSRQRSYRIKI